MPVTMTWGVGDERGRLLAKLNIFTVEDLLLHRPRRYEDRRTLLAIRDLQLKEPATVRGKIVAAGVKRWKRGARAMFECVFDDGSAHLHCRWWHAQPWMEEYFAVGREFLVFGKPDSLRPRTMDHSETELLEPGEDEFIHVNRIVPIHPLTDGLTARVMRTLVWHALERFESQISEPQLTGLPLTSAVPGAGNHKFEIPPGFPSRANAVHMLHFPEALDDAEIARRRLALDEFIALQAQIRVRRHNFETKARAIPCGGNNTLIKPFLSRLQFKLTNSQTQVLREIRSDMRARHPMRRLLQGDVGSGKTVVAACSALMAIENGRSVALMAPTEILAEQHFQNFKKWFDPLGIQVTLRTGSSKNDNERITGNGKRTSSRLVQPFPSMFIGTHALLTANFAVPDLGLVIIDEQHKFGVAQREQLVRKGTYPHLLVMTATPIPRTLGLTVYGELDISVIGEMPGGRGRIQTFIRTADTLPKVWEFIRRKLTEGRQAYVIYPRVEDSAQNDVKAVVKEHGMIKRTLHPFQVGLLHGRMTGRDEGRRDDRVSSKQPPGALVHFARRSRCGCAERHRHAD